MHPAWIDPFFMIQWPDIRHDVANIRPPRSAFPKRTCYLRNMELQRNMRHAVDLALKDTPVVLVNGARQTGKTLVPEADCQQRVAVPCFGGARTVVWTFESVFG